MQTIKITISGPKPSSVSIKELPEDETDIVIKLGELLLNENEEEGHEQN